ncbi:MAG: hypothetical protein P1Q69_05510 [Candidatus Thorarchaeota archaeon]|nr:hypothetical protein [Candidatus Thorarchaeota archaeon]
MSSNTRYLAILSAISVIRIVLYLYWYFWFSDFITPMQITEIGFFLYVQLPLILVTLDLVLIITLLLTKGKTWSLFMIGSLTAIAQSLFLLYGIETVPVVLGFLITIISGLQIVAVLVFAILRRSPTPLLEEKS